MGIFIPDDISERIMSFMAKQIELPLINKDELMATFYIFGKNQGINGYIEIMNVKELAKRTMAQISRDVRMFSNSDSRMNPDSIRQNFHRRAMQILIESKNQQNNIDFDFNKRVSLDPTILTEFFTWHVAFYQKDYFFTIFEPFKEDLLPRELREDLRMRMLLLGFNVKDSSKLSSGPLEIFFEWFRQIKYYK